MAKDRRDNKGKQPQRQVSLADKAGVGQSASPAKKGAARKKTDNTKRKPIAKIIIVSLLVILVAVTLGFLIVVVKYVWDTMNPKENNAPKVQVTSFVSTPEASVLVMGSSRFTAGTSSTMTLWIEESSR